MSVRARSPWVVVVVGCMLILLMAGCSSEVDALRMREGTVSRLNIVWEAVNIYYEENAWPAKWWPADLADLAGAEECRRVLKNLPDDAFSGNNIRDIYGNDLQYSPTGGFGNGPLLYSMGPDGKDGTASEKTDNIYLHEH